MKNLKRIVVVVAAIIAVTMSVSAQFRFGIKGGIDVNSVSLSDLESNFTSENRTGYTAGITTEFTVPIIGLGFDLSVMYVHREFAASTDDKSLQEIFNDPNFTKQDFIEIPLNLKYKLSLPAIDRIVAPYVTTGPSIAFKCSKDAAVDAFKEKKFDAAWNAGAGVQLFHHLQVGANYSWGLTKSLERTLGSQSVDLKTKGWTITAAIFF